MNAIYLMLGLALVCLLLWLVVFHPLLALAWFVVACVATPLAGRRLWKLSA